MPYRRTENVARRLAARRDAIVGAARQTASEGGMAAVQIAAVAARAGIAAGTVYRYFPAKTDLVAALLGEIAEHEIGALRRRWRRASRRGGGRRSRCGGRAWWIPGNQETKVAKTELRFTAALPSEIKRNRGKAARIFPQALVIIGASIPTAAVE